jgi:alpha-L-fucosidase
MRLGILYSAAIVLGMTLEAAGQKYEPTWESLDKRPTPAWFDEAKFGIFIHWGVYSVPAWGAKGTYAEWYWQYMNDPKNPTWKFHAATYGEKFRYQDFAPMFKAEMFAPDLWADLLVRSGAKYVVLTSKHHDGFCLWPSAQSWNWNSMDVGPHRDLCGDLTKAVKARGLKMGLYYSFYEWYHPLYQSDRKRYVEEHVNPQIRDLVTRYEPAVLWMDGDWDDPPELWQSTELLAWLFNESPVRDFVAVNDRFGKGTPRKHGGFYATEYGRGQSELTGPPHKWEENQGMGASFGYNRNEGLEDYRAAAQLIWMLVDVVGRGGNLMLDIGPTADGRIPVIMQQRMVEIGDWLKVNGEAIYGTTRWREYKDGDKIRYTAKGGAIYAITQGWPGRELVLSVPKAEGAVTATLVGYKEPLKAAVKDGKLHIDVPPLSVDEAPCRHVYAFKLTGVK